MRLPFGLDLKSVLVTLIFIWFILPLIQGAFASRTAPRNA